MNRFTDIMTRRFSFVFYYQLEGVLKGKKQRLVFFSAELSSRLETKRRTHLLYIFSRS
jgi:hypothetical protein